MYRKKAILIKQLLKSTKIKEQRAEGYSPVTAIVSSVNLNKMFLNLL